MVSFPRKLGMTASVLLAGAVATGASAQSGPAISDAERAKMELVVRDYILSHPEIILEAMDNLKANQTTKTIGTHRQQVETPYPGAWAGSANGTATLVVFFDYACGYCRKSQPDLQRLLREDKQLKVVFRELPILGEDSTKAAWAGLMAAAQGKYLAFHDGIYAAGNPSAPNIDKVQKAIGFNTAASPTANQSAAIQTELNKNFKLAQDLGITGTPAWVIGDQILSGAIGYDTLKAAIGRARARK